MMMMTTTAIYKDNRNYDNLIPHEERPMWKYSTLTLTKLRLDNQEVRKTLLLRAQYNRPN